MAYAWTQNAESTRAERIPNGKHRVRVLKVLRAVPNTGEQFVSNNGDPQLMLVFQDPQAREVTYMFTLSDRAAFRLAQFMAVCDPPINLAQMEADGVEPMHFSDEGWATQMFANRQCTIQVTANAQDERYPHIDFVKARGAESAPPPPAQTAAVARPAPAPQTAAAAPPPQTAHTRAPYLPPRPDTTPPPVAAAADAPPPPVDTAPPAPRFANKDQAWRFVLEQWASRAVDPAGQAERNTAWASAVREVAGSRTETQLTAQDWSRVAEICGTPF